MDSSQEMLEWFWQEHKSIGQVSYEDGFCQCETENFINRSSDPEQMRAVCLVGTFIDQVIHCHFSAIYSDFSRSYPCPKVRSCHGRGMVHPSWFVHTLTNPYWKSISEKNGYRPKENWEKVESIATKFLSNIFSYLSEYSTDLSLNEKFKSYVQRELSVRFDQLTQHAISGAIVRL